MVTPLSIVYTEGVVATWLADDGVQRTRLRR
jgi:hypothetical protein